MWIYVFVLSTKKLMSVIAIQQNAFLRKYNAFWVTIEAFVFQLKNKIFRLKKMSLRHIFVRIFFFTFEFCFFSAFR